MSSHTCPTCGRRPSERHYYEKYGCPDPIHDIADAAPALLEALEAITRSTVDLRCVCCAAHLIRANEALAAARSQEVSQ